MEGCSFLQFFFAAARMRAGMEENRYQKWDEIFEESNQQDFKEELKQWVREHKDDMKTFCDAHSMEFTHKSPYGLLAALMGVNISSINNWMSQAAEKQIPSKRVENIKSIMREVSQFAENRQIAEAGQTSATEDKEAFVQLLKEKLSYEAVGRFYTEADKAGMTLEDYLFNLLK